MKKVLFIVFVISTLCFSCSKVNLSEDEVKIVQKFLINTWTDSQFIEYSGETIPNLFSLKIYLKNNKLSYSYDENYYASFGDKHFVSTGTVDVYIEREIGWDGIVFKGIKIDLINEDGKLMKSGKIFSFEQNKDLNKDEIIERVKKQVELREKIYSKTFDRINTNLTYYDWSIRGLFSSKISKRIQRQDYSLFYTFNYENHAPDDFKEVTLIGFDSKRHDGVISWNLLEFVNPSLSIKSKPTSIQINKIDTMAVDSLCCD